MTSDALARVIVNDLKAKKRGDLSGTPVELIRQRLDSWQKEIDADWLTRLNEGVNEGVGGIGRY